MSERAQRTRPVRFDPLPEWVGPATRLIHGARRPDRNAGAVVPPLYTSTTYRFPPEFSPAEPRDPPYLYAREGHPTAEPPAELIRQLEGAEAARLFGSGMGALAATFQSLVRTGDEVVAFADIYGGTRTLLTELEGALGIRVRWVTPDETRRPGDLVGPATRLVFLETPSNPLLTVHDIRAWASEADSAGALLIVDNTFATPVNQRPLSLGADLVVHSATKYLGGHSDLMAGVVVGPQGIIDRIDRHHTLGSVPDPWSAYLLHRSLKTLSLRVARQNENARAVATALRRHPAVERVYYPGWNSAEEEAVASRQMTGRGGMVAFDLRGGPTAVRRFLHRLRFVEVASSLGGVESLVSVPRETSHRGLGASERSRLGIGEGLVRLSLGIEETADLLRDLAEALEPRADDRAEVERGRPD
ncbi:MAG: aminotransferase class I/II-fold pyridoxal phosphate-dependent enzyme [Thermoplasmata archaeon]|jgi:cystathionine gamma-synthase